MPSGAPRHGVSKPVRAGAVACAVAALVVACENPQAPVSCGPIPQQTINVAEVASVTACFNDVDGDMLSYAVSSSNESVAIATHGGTEVAVTARAPGSATIAARRVEVGQGVVIALAPWFEEPDGQSLTRLGSDDAHWRKNVFGPELMSPSIAPGSSPLSRVTIASLADMGYEVRMELADAYRLPGAAAVLAHQRRAIDLGNDVVRPRVQVRDRNGRVVKIEPGGG